MFAYTTKVSLPTPQSKRKLTRLSRTAPAVASFCFAGKNASVVGELSICNELTTQRCHGTCIVGGGGKFRDFLMKFEPLSLRTAKVRTLSDDTLQYPKIQRFRKSCGS